MMRFYGWAPLASISTNKACIFRLRMLTPVGTCSFLEVNIVSNDITTEEVAPQI